MLKELLVCVLLLFVNLEAKRPVMTASRMPSEPYITGDGFRALADHVFDETDASLEAHEIGYGDLVFVKTDMLDSFFSEVHPYVSVPYILISHNADHSAPGKFECYLNDPKILRWFAQNPTIEHHDKFEAIPIGIENRYVASDRLQNCLTIEDKQKGTKKDLLLGINFRSGTNTSARQGVFDFFSSQSYCRQIYASVHIDYLDKMSRAKFILSPAGNGLDCHRTWEAIIVGTIPIVLSSELDELLQGLPVVIVKDWHNINQAFLEQVFAAMKQDWGRYDMAKARYGYWEERIRSYQKYFREHKIQ